MAKPISETLKMFQGGDFNIKAGELFASVLRGVEDTGKAGKLTITLDVKQQNGAVSVLANAGDLVARLRTDVLWHQRRGNETIAADCREAADEIERLRAAPVVQQPIGYMSAKQVSRIVDPDGEFGTYIPMRKTPGGLFTLALYAAPQPQALQQILDNVRSFRAEAASVQAQLDAVTAACEATQAPARVALTDAEKTVEFSRPCYQSEELYDWFDAGVRFAERAHGITTSGTKVAARREPWTALEKGVIAGDGRPCPNDHDPDCRWPQCVCREREAAQGGTKGAAS